MQILEHYVKKLTAYQADKRALIAQKERTKSNLDNLAKRYDAATKAQIILQDVANRTQENIRIRIESLVNAALESVHPNPPKFVINFTTKNNMPHCELLFEENGKTYRPLDGSGYGIANITSFALRIAVWSLKKTRNVMVLDEPFASLSPDLHSKAGEMLVELSKKTGIQFICISHSETVNESADKVFIATKKNETTQIKEQQ